MTDKINPIENGLQQAYNEVCSSLELILAAGVGPELFEEAITNPGALVQQVLTSLDDAISNNWDQLMESFWHGVRQDVDLMDEKSQPQ